MKTTRKEPIVKDLIVLRCGRKLAYCEHGVKDGEPIVFFAGAGFGRIHVPTPFPDLLEKNTIRFITVDRPGYGSSDPHIGRTHVDWVDDIKEMMDHIGLRRARFLAHSAGTPHLAAVCKFAPERVISAVFVCPVSPIVGNTPVERPPENFSRGCARFCLLNFGSFMDSIFGFVFAKWQEDPKKFVRDSKAQIVAPNDVAFMDQHPEFFQEQFLNDFQDAVKAPNGVSAMLEDMFHLNKVAWNFAYSDLHVSKSQIPVQVWWGSADDTAPHGKWICDQIGIEGRCVNNAGHGLIQSEFGAIVEDLLRIGS